MSKSNESQPEAGSLWQCCECGVARPILDDDWSCDCPDTKVEEAYNWRRIDFTFTDDPKDQQER